MVNKIKTEDDECYALVDYLERLKGQGKVLLFSHIPQETYTKSWGVKMKNKRLGVRSGVPDYIIVTPKKTVWIEMKRMKGGKVSLAQKEWVEALENAHVCCGFDEARKIIDISINN